MSMRPTSRSEGPGATCSGRSTSSARSSTCTSRLAGTPMRRGCSSPRRLAAPGSCGVNKFDRPVDVRRCRGAWEPVRLQLVLAFLLYRVLCGLLSLLVRMGVDYRELEIAVLRHQLRILGRRGKRPRYRTGDRAVLAAASRFLPRERWSAFSVGPDTLTRWRRTLVSRKGSNRRRPGRPPIDPAVRELILRMARENARWGYL